MTSPKNISGIRAFTLIELLVVISIIGLLASIAMASFTVVRKKAQNTAILAELYEFNNWAEGYRITYGTYPTGSCPNGSQSCRICHDPTKSNWPPSDAVNEPFPNNMIALFPLGGNTTMQCVSYVAPTQNAYTSYVYLYYTGDSDVVKTEKNYQALFGSAAGCEYYDTSPTDIVQCVKPN